MKNSHHKNYSDLSLDELEKLVEELETMSIKALKERKKTLRSSIEENGQEKKGLLWKLMAIKMEII